MSMGERPLWTPCFPSTFSRAEGQQAKAGHCTSVSRAWPNNRVQATASSVRSVRREAAWKHVETPGVYRHPGSPWRAASSTTLWGEPPPPARPQAREPSPPQVGAWLRHAMGHPLQRGNALRGTRPLTALGGSGSPARLPSQTHGARSGPRPASEEGRARSTEGPLPSPRCTDWGAAASGRGKEMNTPPVAFCLIVKEFSFCGGLQSLQCQGERGRGASLGAGRRVGGLRGGLRG